MVTIYDPNIDDYRKLTDDEIHKRLCLGTKMGSRYFMLRSLIAFAIKEKRRLPKDIKKLFLEQQKEIDEEYGYSPEESASRLKQMARTGRGEI